MAHVTAAPKQVEIAEPGRYVVVTPNDYLDIRSREWAEHEAGGRVRFFARMVHVDRACTDILRAIDAIHPGTYSEIAALLESRSGATATV